MLITKKQRRVKTEEFTLLKSDSVSAIPKDNRATETIRVPDSIPLFYRPAVFI
ncbi:MAG: hypothetical protein WBB23_06960 [Desulforhopalus sp.]